MNRKLLTLVRQGDLQGLTPAEVHAAYTGLGGLHGLHRNDYGSYHAFARDKRELELGQFFTPPDVARDLVRLLDPTPGQVLLDLGVGHGSFINAAAGHHADLEATFYGCDVDADALTIARYLYPRAQLHTEDMASFHPGRLVDTVLMNPAYALTLYYGGRHWRSEFLALQRAAELLKPGGLLAAIVPESFLSDAFHDRTHLERLGEQYRFLTRYRVRADAFDADVRTTVLVLQRASVHLAAAPIDPTYLDERPLEVIRALVTQPANAEAHALRARLLGEAKTRGASERALLERIERDLYHLHARERTRALASEHRALLERALHERKPEGMSQARWEEERVTLETVADRTRRALRDQHQVERGETRLVRTNAGVRLKGYSRERRTALATAATSAWSWSDLADGEHAWPPELRASPLRRAARRKQRRRDRHHGALATLVPDEATVQQLMREPLHKRTPTGREAFRFTRTQAEDVARLLERDCAFLALGMGSGKTAMGYRWLARKARARDLKIVLAPALAIHQTWVPFLDANDHPYRLVTDRRSALEARAGETLLVSMSRLHALKRPLKRALRRNAHRTVLLVDEADEFANWQTRQTAAALAVFRRARAKLLMTGTITRNAIREAYPQLSLLYGASTLFTSLAPSVYEADDDGILVAKPNPQYGEPFVHRSGFKNFTQAYNPVATTVFGIEKQVQDVYNLGTLSELMGRTLIRRSFNEVVGPDKYTIVQHDVPFRPEERALHERLMTEFHEFLAYFERTDSSRKEAGLRAVRQLRLLIESCLHAHRFKEYEGTEVSSKFLATRDLVASLPHGERVLLGLPRRRVFGRDYLQDWSDLLAPTGRERFTLHGGMSFGARQNVIDRYLASDGGVLLASMDALRSSVNLRGTRQVVMPALGWNLSRIHQFAFRAVRFDNEHPTQIHFLTHSTGSVEANLWRLLVSKEVGNLAVAEGRVPTQEEISRDLAIDERVLSSLLAKERDADGHMTLAWTSNLFRTSLEAPA